MRKVIEKIKQKPEQVRRHILLGTSLAITGIIFGSWMFLFHSEFSKTEKKPDLASDLKPLSMLKDDFLKTFHTVSDGIGSMRNGLKSDAIPADTNTVSPAHTESDANVTADASATTAADGSDTQTPADGSTVNQ